MSAATPFEARPAGGAGVDGPRDDAAAGRRLDRAEEIVRHEWRQFQVVANEGGRANCQDDWPTFHQMRISQFLTWPQRLLDSYARDLDEADALGRNLLTEKYGRMMASAEPERYARDIESHLPRLSTARVAVQERIIAAQVAWARDFRSRYPRLGDAMRLLTSDQDTVADTSFETYLRGELGTYSPRTLRLYEDLVDRLAAAGENLTELTLLTTVRLAGHAGLAEAEAAQRD
ncbi:DUF4125 family protein [Demequina pelophila]|uniref:DUF4125 family protein n=1 Tax=Demequina pelophila TaxID=1638984 RepID=UPI0009E53034|nr:DUF4125 family protein [Demequina pelophila]